MPKARRVNLLWDSSTGPWQLAAAKAAAGRLRFDVDTLVVRDDGEFERELADGMQRKPDALAQNVAPMRKRSFFRTRATVTSSTGTGVSPTPSGNRP